jgi:VIT1/CCC1 family predicted Fe2+/Mn2+ transporter
MFCGNLNFLDNRFKNYVMTESRHISAGRPISGANFPYRQFILGALVPILVFYGFHRLGRSLVGAMLAICWSLGLLAVAYWRSRRVELFPALAIPIISIELTGTFITRNSDYYLASAAIDKILWGLLFL